MGKLEDDLAWLQSLGYQVEGNTAVRKTEDLATIHAPMPVQEDSTVWAPVERVPAVGTREPQRKPYWPYRSRTEQRYAAILDQRQRRGDVRRWWYEPLKLRLGEQCYYTADFLVMAEARPDTLALIETKGAYVREDSIIKLKTAAQQYPCFIFVLAQYKNSQWSERVIRWR